MERSTHAASLWASVPPSLAAASPSPPGRHLCCTSALCVLCAQSQARRCAAPFSAKYLVGDALRAPCGAAVRWVKSQKARAAGPAECGADSLGTCLQVLHGHYRCVQ